MAVVGAGRMGRVHLQALHTSDGVELTAVMDSVVDSAQEAAAKHGLTAHTSLDSLLAVDGVEAWLVATPTPTHPALVERALEHGIHVLCEKPLSLDEGDHERLAGLAAAHDLVLQVGFWRRFASPWAEAKRLLHEGAIGTPLYLRLAQWDADPPPPEFCDPKVSGGLAIDCGVHEYDLAEWLTGRPIVSVTACNLPVVDQGVGASGDVDNLVALLNLEGGATATVDLSRNARYGDDVRTEILGSDGALFVDLLPHPQLRLATHQGITDLLQTPIPDGTIEGVVNQATTFARKVRHEEVEIPDAAASRRALRVGRAVQRSATDGGSHIEV